MNRDLISIIMPSYNCEQFIEGAIHGVQAQTYLNWELIVVDDCSTDGTLQKVIALQANDSRIIIIQNVHNSGAAVSRNVALRNAKGRWIAFLDSDDLWEPTKLEKQIRFMEEKGHSFSYTNYQELGQDTFNAGVWGSSPKRIMVSGPKRITKWGMYAFCWPGCLTVMYDAEKVGLVQIADIKKNNDYAMWLKVCKKADCYLLDECLAKYRRGRQGSISTHGYKTLIKWHYILWRDAEGMSPVSAAVMTGVNLFFGLMKKVLYVKKIIR